MKLKRSAITGNVTRKRNSHVATESVLLSCGSVTMTMIVEMTVTSRLIFAGTGTVLRAGEDAQVTQTTDASLNGFIVLEKMPKSLK